MALRRSQNANELKEEANLRPAKMDFVHVIVPPHRHVAPTITQTQSKEVSSFLHLFFDAPRTVYCLQQETICHIAVAVTFLMQCFKVYLYVHTSHSLNSRISELETT